MGLFNLKKTKKTIEPDLKTEEKQGDISSNVIFDQKNILVIGGAGFIGSNLIERLLEKNKVVCIDNFITGKSENIEQALQFPNFTLIKHDMGQKIDLESLNELKKFRIKWQGIQDIIYMACPTSYKDYNKYAIETIDANSVALKNALELAVKYKTRFLFGSSSAIYGNAEDVQDKVKETYIGKTDHLGPRSAYNEGKKFGEMMVKNYHEKYKLDISIARIFATYGPRMILNDGRLIPDFIENAMQNKNLIIPGNENSITSLCYIEDMVDGILKLMDTPIYDPVNLGGDEKIKIKDMAEKIIELTHSKSKIVFEDKFKYFQRKLIADISKAKESLGWIPMIKLENGLQKTIKHVQREKAGLNPSKINPSPFSKKVSG